PPKPPFMNEALIAFRNSINCFFYKQALKRIFFRLDPEKVHDRITFIGVLLGKNILTRKLTKFNYSYSNKILEQKILGIKFKNPVGLAAGFDKNGELTDIIPNVGFGFMEIGSITGNPCSGNPKPRLWRLKKLKSLVVNYGLKNNGCEEISKRLKNKKFEIPIGTSIAKTNCKETVETGEGIKDYLKGFKSFTEIGDYYTINISCPNAFGGQPFTDAKKLDLLLNEIDKVKTKKPIFLKISPDLSKKEVDKILETSSKHRIHGFICANLTKKVKNEFRKFPDALKGGLSGKATEDLANDLISYLYQRSKGKYVIIGVGGIFSKEDAYKKIKLGASLVQLTTGMIFEGPQLISQINKGLVQLLKKDKLTSISQAVGLASKGEAF
ncbi:MAG: quinone-dependent dihydroorotate dehydrogenase, partial [bacterium]|nr:quinone-dependent dihydroorotate dehydrogenase [bacterium]